MLENGTKPELEIYLLFNYFSLYYIDRPAPKQEAPPFCLSAPPFTRYQVRQPAEIGGRKPIAKDQKAELTHLYVQYVATYIQ